MAQGKRLSEEEINRQSELLEPLRRTHNLEIIHSGLAARAISSPILVNFHSIHSEPSVDTTFYPFRSRLDTIPYGMVASLLREIGFSRPSTEEDLETMIRITGARPDAQPSYAIMLGRVDGRIDGGSTSAPYYLGFDLGEQSNTLLASNLAPFEGILEDDLIMARRQLTEIAFAKMQLGLDIIDDETLADDPEIVGY